VATFVTCHLERLQTMTVQKHQMRPGISRLVWSSRSVRPNKGFGKKDFGTTDRLDDNSMGNYFWEQAEGGSELVVPAGCSRIKQQPPDRTKISERRLKISNSAVWVCDAWVYKRLLYFHDGGNCDKVSSVQVVVVGNMGPFPVDWGMGNQGQGERCKCYEVIWPS
jgi:hypothetical protein